MTDIGVFYLCDVLQPIMERFYQSAFSEQNLSAILIREFLILFLTLVKSCIPLRKRLSNKACPIYPLSAHNFPLMFSRNLPCLNGSRSSTSTFPGVNMKLRISPLSLIIRCSLNPKNHPMEHFPRSVVPSNVL